MQIPLSLIDPPAPALRDGVVGHNAQALRALEEFAQGKAGEGLALMLWGSPGSGKTFWLKAWANARPGEIRYADCAEPTAAHAMEEWLHGAADAQPMVWMVDNADASDEKTASALFRLYNALRERKSTLVVAASAPPLRLSVRDDLRTRLGQALIYEFHELDDEQKKTALQARARQLGWEISEELLHYLMTRLARDLGLLMRVVGSLDRLALSRQRTPTVPLLKELLDSVDAAGAL